MLTAKSARIKPDRVKKNFDMREFGDLTGDGWEEGTGITGAAQRNFKLPVNPNQDGLTLLRLASGFGIIFGGPTANSQT